MDFSDGWGVPKLLIPIMRKLIARKIEKLVRYLCNTLAEGSQKTTTNYTNNVFSSNDTRNNVCCRRRSAFSSTASGGRVLSSNRRSCRICCVWSRSISLVKSGSQASSRQWCVISFESDKVKTITIFPVQYDATAFGHLAQVIYQPGDWWGKTFMVRLHFNDVGKERVTPSERELPEDGRLSRSHQGAVLSRLDRSHREASVEH